MQFALFYEIPVADPSDPQAEYRAYHETLEQAVFGATVPVTVRTALRCDDCGGTGAGEGTQPVTCSECNGRGQVQRVRQSMLGQMVTSSACQRCGGMGQVIATPCATCRGDGRVITEKTYQVDVPAGVDTGSTLRLTGRGAVLLRPGGLFVVEHGDLQGDAGEGPSVPSMLRAFLDHFGFDYEFASSTEYYKSGRFDETLLKMLANYDKVMDIILPTLGPDRRATYSPFLPVSPRSGQVLQVPMVARDEKRGTVAYDDPDTGERMVTPVTRGMVKCQWKADWAMRWTALGIDYEMAGKDLIDSVVQSSKIARVLGGRPVRRVGRSPRGSALDRDRRLAAPERVAVHERGERGVRRSDATGRVGLEEADRQRGQRLVDGRVLS